MNVPIFILLGSNMGDRLSYLYQARQEISRLIGQIITVSSVYRTSAWGKTDQPEFYNQVLEINSSLNPQELLSAVLEIELKMGRVRNQKWEPRVIDIDILLWGDLIIMHEQLTVPHLRMADRKFVLLPLTEIAPDFVHPVARKSIQEMLAECTDQLMVEKLKGTDHL